MYIETDRLLIVPFIMDMAKDVHVNSLDEDTRRYLPDEVFETEADARDTLSFLMSAYKTCDGPLVYPFLLKDKTFLGYVQAVPMDSGEWEIGYHIGKKYTGQGYTTEAVRFFLPVIMEKLSLHVIHGICHADNKASVRVLEKCGFQKVFEGIAPYQGMNTQVVKFVYSR